VNRFAATLCRSKTDPADAHVLAEYARRMPFQSWPPPPVTALELRTITRHIATLTQQHTRQSNRLHAASASSTGARCVRHDLKRSLRDLERRADKMRRAALALVEQDAELRSRFALLLSVPGIAEVSALHLLGELALLAPSLSVRQWVAHSGLDPAHHDSGTSVHKRSRISRAGNRYLRRALYMPALVAVRHDPHLRAFYQTLVARHKAKLQALMAVARKMLHAIFGMFRGHSGYDGSRLFPALALAAADQRERFSRTSPERNNA
jgi:transposase